MSRDFLLETTQAVASEQALTIHSSGAAETQHVSCFNGFRPSRAAATTEVVPYKDVLWSEETPEGTLVTYATGGKSDFRVCTKTIDLGSYSPGELWAQHIMKRAYPASHVSPRILLVLNRFGGTGHAARLYEKWIKPVLHGARAHVTYIETESHGHAEQIAMDLDVAKYDVVVCCSGDGVPHEILNGLYQRPDRETALAQLAVTQLPCGSGNALSLSTHGTSHAGLAAVCMLKLQRTRMDLMALTQGGRTRLSFLSQLYGAIADADIGTDHLRWLGPVRFEVGFLGKLISKAKYPCELWVKYAAKDSQVHVHWQEHQAKLGPGVAAAPVVRAITPGTTGLDTELLLDWERVPNTGNVSVFYTGKMPYVLTDAQFFPAALPNDGLMDLVLTTTEAPVLNMLKLLLTIDRGRHVESKDVHYAKILAYRLVPKVAGGKHFLLVDGESYPFEPLQVEVLQGAMTTLMTDGAFVQTDFA